jgi:hypothetical protein
MISKVFDQTEFPIFPGMQFDGTGNYAQVALKLPGPHTTIARSDLRSALSAHTLRPVPKAAVCSTSKFKYL